MQVVKKSKSEKARLIEGLVDEEFFDAEYYSLRYMSGVANRSEAAKHFAENMDRDFRSPNKDFDAWAYVCDYPDVRASGLNPFVHYLAFGADEGRSISTLSAPNYREARLLSELCASQQRVRNVRVAICIHLFYQDFLPLIAKRLTDFPYPADVFVSCRDDDAKVATEDALRDVIKGSLVVEIVPNHGRNIAPLVVQFGGRLAKYDIVGHVHTKKSLYTGTEKREWNDHLFSGVFGSDDYIEGIFKRFLSDDRLQLVSSEMFYDLPFWAAHQLSNSDGVKALCNRLGLEHPGEFVDYPVGGMFWARGKIFARLDDLGLSYDDFDMENGQIDGTFHHAVERVIGLLAVENGGKFLKYSPRYGILYSDDDYWRHLYEKRKLTDLRGAIFEADVASFDFFDTLVSRNAAEVEEAKISMSQKLAGTDLPGYQDYRELRNAAELAVRKGKDWQGDAGFLEIAGAMAALADIPEGTALKWLHQEAEFDLDLFIQRRTIADIYSHLLRQGKRVIVVSDTFYNRVFLERVLDRSGLPKPSAMYLSSEIGARKDRGDLWHYVRHAESGSICHVGDNMVSDVQNPTNLGIDAHFVAKAIDKAKWLGVIKKYPQREHWGLVAGAVSSFGDDPFFS